MYLIMSDVIEIILNLTQKEKDVLEKENLQNLDLSNSNISFGIEELVKKELIKKNEEEKIVIELDKFGKKFLNSKLPEVLLAQEIKESSKEFSKINLEKEVISFSLNVLKLNKLIEIKKEKSLTLKFLGDFEKFEKENKNLLNLFEKEVEEKNLTQEQKKFFEKMKNRKGFLKKSKKKVKTFSLTKKGIEVKNYLKKNFKDLKLVDVLTPKMLKENSFLGKTFKHYDINIKSDKNEIGRRHPTYEANNILRDIFIEMGFKEMRGPIVETAFFNMDILWIPQDHPARDEQDTFYLNMPKSYKEEYIDKTFMNKVKKMHEEGIKFSHTPKGDWSEKVAKKKLLRTHSTSTTFRTLYNLSKQKDNKNINGKYFYISNNFRNEAVDATHLAEFFQAEGILIGDDLSLAQLMGFMCEFYKKLGLEKLRFKPTFNPYTEPSLEIHYYSEKLKKWFSVGNSGIFRAETLKPMGLEKKTIFGWGLGASRLASILTKKSSLKELTGHTCDFKWLKNREVLKRKI